MDKAFNFVTVPLLHPEDPNQRVEKALPFLDPHEYLEYIWSTQRIYIPDEEIVHLG